jgi:hypothetical protein
MIEQIPARAKYGDQSNQSKMQSNQASKQA